MPIQRHISLLDQRNAQRLKRLWRNKHAELNLDQAKAAKRLGITQSAISQYLNCKIALNTDMILKFAVLLKIQPTDINPELKQYPITYNHVKVTGSLMNTNNEGVSIQAPANSDTAYALLVDTHDYHPRVQFGNYLILDPALEPTLNDLVLFGETPGLGVVEEAEDGIYHLVHPTTPTHTTFQGAPTVVVGIYIRRP